MFRSVILAASRSRRVERLAGAARPVRDMASGLLAGDDIVAAVSATGRLVAEGIAVSVARLAAPGDVLRDEYLQLLEALSDAELTPEAEISVSLSHLASRGEADAGYEAAHAICARATECGTTVTLEAREHTATDTTLDTLQRLRADFPTTGVTLQAQFRRTETDCRELAATGARVRLCTRDRPEPEAVAYQPRLEIDRSFVRCLRALLAGGGYAMVATADPRLIAIAEDRARWFERTADEFEFQLHYGECPDQQQRLASAGYTVRSYLPYGDAWYPYLVGRLVERPSALGQLLRKSSLPS